MDFAALPPEVNAARLYAGPGAGPLLAAATAWDQIGSELRGAAAGYASTLSRLAGAWQGPAAASMAAATAPYASWLTTTAARAEHTAQQVRIAAAGYEAARAATVPPPVVAANRAERQTLIATNVLGQNTGAIAANDSQYAGMWSQNAAAMHGYAAQAGKAGQLPSFTPPPQAGTADAATATSAPGLAGVVDGLNASPLGFAAAHVELLSDAILPANSTLINTIMGLGMATKGLDVTAEAAGGGGLGASLAAGLDTAPTGSGPARGASPVTAGVGRAGAVGALSVPTSWAASTPAIRTVASVLSGTAQDAVTAAAMSRGSLLSTVAAAGAAGGALGAAGGALGAAVPNVAAGRGRDGAASTRTALKDGDAPQNLQRLVAEMVENPEQVQHWHTDSEHLDDLLAVLRRKPGTHAVHLKNGDSSVLPPRSAL